LFLKRTVEGEKAMKTAVLLLNFGEPEAATLEEVVPFLERIFTTNAALMGPATPEEVRARSRRLAEERAPGLIEEYREIGGSPLHRQARWQAAALQAELDRRGHDAVVLLGMQFTRPSIREALERARGAGAERVVAFPVYPLTGPSTTVAALEELDRERAALGWEVEVRRLTGFHSHPAYVRLRAGAVRRVLEAEGLSLAGGRTLLVFSAHGTPLKYLEEGSRYGGYVHDFCAAVAAAVGAPEFALGFQNHSNRPGVRWTQPETSEVIRTVEAERVVVDAVSFLHEQSETLAELDGELREQAEARGLGFHRVPVPWDDPALVALLADLVSPFTGAPGAWADAAAGDELAPCRCFPRPGTFCCTAALEGAPAALV
jgi:protoporphyrin/coproporphyrin ferrochelatase